MESRRVPPEAAGWSAPDAETVVTRPDFTQDPEYAAKKAQILAALEPTIPVSSRQRFASHDTSYDNPDRYPGVVRFRTEGNGSYEPGLVREASTVEGSREYLILTGQIKALTDKRKPIGDDLKEEAEDGWRGSEFDDLDGVGRVLTTKTETTAKVTSPDKLHEAAGSDFSRVAKRRVTVTVEIEEGLKMRGGTMSSELIRSIIEGALVRGRLNTELQGRLVKWGETETIFTDLDVLRELIEADRIPLDSIQVERTFDLVPNVLPSEKSPKPKDPAPDSVVS